MSGNCAIGIWANATRPASVITIEMTAASRGRAIKTPEIMSQAPGLISVAFTTCPGRIR